MEMELTGIEQQMLSLQNVEVQAKTLASGGGGLSDHLTSPS